MQRIFLIFRLKLRCKHRTCVYTLQPMQQPRRKRRDSSSDDDRGDSLTHLETDDPRQCYGPTCINSARWGSKYCSDECGLKLATSRIYQVLPQRIQEWSLSPCVAEDKNKKALDQVNINTIELKN